MLLLMIFIYFKNSNTAYHSFPFQLSSLYEGRPPVSRAKMAQLTKSAIKAIKFYKHVVQSVERFIQKVEYLQLF